MDTIFIPANVSGDDLEQYFRSHVVLSVGNNTPDQAGVFYTVTKPLHVFKKVSATHEDVYETAHANVSMPYRHEVIASLIIPVGATIYAQSLDGKMRSDVAIVAAMCAYVRPSYTRPDLSDLFWTHRHTAGVRYDFDPRLLCPVSKARSQYCSSFEYVAGETVRPDREFSLVDKHCDSGIHFFLNVREALAY